MKNKTLIIVLLLLLQGVMWYSNAIFHIITEPNQAVEDIKNLRLMDAFWVVLMYLSYAFRLWLIVKTIDLFWTEKIDIDTIIKFVRTSIIAWLISGLIFMGAMAMLAYQMRDN